MAEFAIADSEYNKQDLIRYGYTWATSKSVSDSGSRLRIMRKSRIRKVINKYGDDGYVNILLQGRVVPNKNRKTLLMRFTTIKIYQSKIKTDSVGSYAGIDRYHEQLEVYVKALDLEDVFY